MTHVCFFSAPSLRSLRPHTFIWLAPPSQQGSPWYLVLCWHGPRLREDNTPVLPLDSYHRERRSDGLGGDVSSHSSKLLSSSPALTHHGKDVLYLICLLSIRSRLLSFSSLLIKRFTRRYQIQQRFGCDREQGTVSARGITKNWDLIVLYIMWDTWLICCTTANMFLWINVGS